MAEIRQDREDLQPVTTRDLGSVTPTADDIRAFAAQFDPQPFHLDVEAGRACSAAAKPADAWI
jgi:acyl dehydratase